LSWQKDRENFTSKIPKLSKKKFHTISFPFSFFSQHLPLLLHIISLLIVPPHCYAAQHFRVISISAFTPELKLKLKLRNMAEFFGLFPSPSTVHPPEIVKSFFEQFQW